MYHFFSLIYKKEEEIPPSSSTTLALESIAVSLMGVGSKSDISSRVQSNRAACTMLPGKC